MSPKAKLSLLELEQEVCCLVVVMRDGFMARERGPDWALKPPAAKGSRVEWHAVKAATIYRGDQVADKATNVV